MKRSVLSLTVCALFLTLITQAQETPAVHDSTSAVQDSVPPPPPPPPVPDYRHVYKDLKYRCIGPFRAGRTVGAAGIPTQPGVFYIGVNNGGVWKTDDYGRTWKPLFDEMPTGSIGDLAIASSDPRIIYVGTGEGLHRPDLSVGNGMYKSEDGGKTWKHSGLEDVQQVARVIVHPDTPNIVFVAGLGHPYGANAMRGVFRSKDGGKTWEKVLYINTHTGAMQVEFDPTDPNTLYADMWEHQEGPWENAAFSGPNSGLYKSTDGGTTWRQLTNGLPTAGQGLGRIGIDIAQSQHNRLYAVVQAGTGGGIYRSDDAGESWRLISKDGRLNGRGADFGEVRVHPKNPDIVYIANVAAYRSLDGGKTWTCIKGAPGGDDYHRIWINPLQPDIMLFAADQGAVVTVNGGKSWSSWYNQPTAQLYHVTTDNQFPYWVYGGQQESGAIGIASRGNGGQISFRDWMGVGADEYGYVAPDPRNPDLIYGGRVTRFNKKTGQTQQVGPETLRSGDVRYLRTMPLMFHPADPKTLLFGSNVLWKTEDGGQNWEQISPDLTRMQPKVPESVGDFATPQMDSMARRAIIYALGPSSVDQRLIWAGTDDGLVHLTTDGGQNWRAVTPPTLTSWDKIAQIDAGHFDLRTAYIAVNAFRKDDLRAHIYKTHDAGVTWQKIVVGLENAGPVNVVREDPKKPGLLYAGTEKAVYFSPDDGGHWFPLQQNMPVTSIRDLVVQDNDLVIGTHGRSIWIMDDVTPLRNMTNALYASRAILYRPATATRVRFNMFSDTPIPPDEPMGQNPPDGAILDYYLPKAVQEITLEIRDENGLIVRRYRSSDRPVVLDTLDMQHPTYWMRPDQKLETDAGHHRFLWDLRYTPPRSTARSYPISAVYKNTTWEPLGPFVPPGKYTLRMIADTVQAEQSITVRLDPRVKISEEDLTMQTSLSLQAYDNYKILQDMREDVDRTLSDTTWTWGAGMKEKLEDFRGHGDPDASDILYGSIRSVPLEKESIVSLQSKYLYMLSILQSADVRPTDQAVQAMFALNARLREMVARKNQ